MSIENIGVDQPKVETKNLQENGYEIRYYVSGKADGELVFFLHPAFSDHSAFNTQIEAFAKEYRVITIDLLGHGLSKMRQGEDKIDKSTNHIAKVLALEKYDKAHFVSVSMGSLLAQYFALSHPDKVASQTLVGSYNINVVDKEIGNAQLAYNLKLAIRAIFSKKAFRSFLAKMTAVSEKGQAAFYASAKHFELKSLNAMQGLQYVIKDRTIGRNPYPTLIVSGDGDLEISKKAAKKWQAQLDNSQYVLMKDAGHCANMDKPEEFNELVLNFLKSYKE